MTNHYQELQINSSLETLIKKLEERESVFTFVYGRAGNGGAEKENLVYQTLQSGHKNYVIDSGPTYRKFASPINSTQDNETNLNLNPFADVTEDQGKALLSNSNWQLIINNQKEV